MQWQQPVQQMEIKNITNVLDGQLFSDASAKAETSLEEVTVKASGHKYGTPIYTWNDDVTVCTASRKCDECDETENENANAESKVIQAQTCTNPEITARTATFVNSAFAAQTKNVQTKEAAGHTAGDWIVDKEPTVTIEGSRHKECTVCRTDFGDRSNCEIANTSCIQNY